MNNTAEQFIAANKANLQTLEGFAAEAFTGIEKLVELNLAASKAAFGESFSHVQSVLGAKDAQDLLALQSGFLKPIAEKSAAYAQHVQTIVADSSAVFSQTVEAKAAEAQEAFTGVVTNLAKNAPAGTESAVAAFKTALSAGQSAVETAQASARKVLEVAQANVKAASKQAVDAAKKVASVA